jgi:hypothetical protein
MTKGNVWSIPTAKSDVCRLCVTATGTRGRGLETFKSSALLEIRV